MYLYLDHCPFRLVPLFLKPNIIPSSTPILSLAHPSYIISDHLASQTGPVVAASAAAMQAVTVALIAGGVLLLLGLVWLGFR